MIKSRRLRWAGHVVRMQENRSRRTSKIFTGKPSRKRRRARRKWENNIRMDLKDIGIVKRNWIDSAQDMDYWRTLVNAALDLWIPEVKELLS